MPTAKTAAKVPPNPTLPEAPPRIPAPAGSFPAGTAGPLPNRRTASAQLGVFSSNAEPATAPRPVPHVQIGGFGSPAGRPGEASPGTVGNVPKLGSFDSPSGQANAHGSAGSRRSIGTVQTAGFGDAVAGPDEGNKVAGSQPGDEFRQSGFGDVGAVAQAPKPQTRSVTLVQVEILSKPTPVYTDEARRLHVEGEVMVEVVFAASGELRALRIVKGLGHGLDEAALRAATGIRFKPARRDDLPVDTVATLHIVFQLAN
jgi:TonB family protein